jgi:hypothetical protein
MQNGRTALDAARAVAFARSVALVPGRSGPTAR